MIKDLGLMNFWKEKPEEYINCIKLKHKPIQRYIGRCYNEYICKKCKIKFRIDSSD